jgi:hypothetical protein
MQPRRRRVKSDQQIRSYIVNAMRMYGAQPPAFLNVMTGFVAQLQEEMKRETEDSLAERACQGRHPGRAPAGVYCKLCHSSEMTGHFAGLPPEFEQRGGGKGRDLVLPGDDPNAAPADLDDDEMLDIQLLPPKE